MRTATTLTLAALLLPGISMAGPKKPGTGIGEILPKLTLEVTRPGSKPKKVKVTAYVFLGTSCPTTARYIDRFKELEQGYGKKGVEFIYLYPNKTDSSEAKRAFHEQKGLAGSMVDDRGAEIAKLVKAGNTSEVLLVDKAGVLLFRGAVDDAAEPAKIKHRYVATALDEHLAGKKVTTPASQVFA
jgi:hypothetical protein